MPRLDPARWIGATTRSKGALIVVGGGTSIEIKVMIRYKIPKITDILNDYETTMSDTAKLITQLDSAVL